MTTSFLLADGSNAALITFLIYTLAVFGIAALSNQLLKSNTSWAVVVWESGRSR